MRILSNTGRRVGTAVVAGSLVLLASCATAPRAQQLRTFFLPPPRAVAIPDHPPIEPPQPAPDLDASELPYLPTTLPSLTASLASVPRPTETDFLIKTAEDRFAAGKRAFQAGRADDARR